MIFNHQIKVLISDKYPDSLTKSWEAAYPDFKYRYPKRFQWLHTNNPLRKELGSSFLYVEEEGNVAAWTSAIYHKLNICKKLVNASFGADTFTLKQYRGKGFASVLQKKSTENVDCWWGISLSPANRRIFLKIGFYEGPTLNRYFKVLTKLSKQSFYSSAKSVLNHKSSFVRWAFTNPASLKLSYVLISKILKARSKNLLMSEGYSIKEINEFDQDTDQIWSKFKIRFDLANDRNHKYLNWRYNEAPFVNYKKYIVLYKESPVGFFVYRIASKLQGFEAYLTEFIVSEDHSHIEPLLLNAIGKLVQQDGGRVLFTASSIPKNDLLFEKHGFIKFGDFIPIIHFSESLRKEIDLPELTNKHSKWFMSLGDHDLEYHYPRMMQPDYISLMNILKNKLKFF